MCPCHCPCLFCCETNTCELFPYYFSPDTMVSPHRHDITEILSKVALDTTTPLPRIILALL